MRATRRTQPYRKGKGRPAGQTLRSMLSGRTGNGYNPQDSRRRLRRRRGKAIRY